MQELRSEAGKTVEDMDEDENFPDPADRASMESNRNSVLRIRDRERKLIFKIQEALRRLDDGNYGICEECGEEIRIERLKARPVTTLCIGCKSSQEIEEGKARKVIYERSRPFHETPKSCHTGGGLRDAVPTSYQNRAERAFAHCRHPIDPVRCTRGS